MFALHRYFSGTFVATTSTQFARPKPICLPRSVYFILGCRGNLPYGGAPPGRGINGSLLLCNITIHEPEFQGEKH